ncbi:MAG: single-stranded DNA-binding protein [Burkholderiales bacterium]
MIKIEIKSDKVEAFSGVSKKTGRPFSMNNQTGYANLIDANGEVLRQAIKITLSDDQKPYQPGFYTLAPSSFFIDSFSRLVVGRIALLPFAQSAPARQAA